MRTKRYDDEYDDDDDDDNAYGGAASVADKDDDGGHGIHFVCYFALSSPVCGRPPPCS